MTDDCIGQERTLTPPSTAETLSGEVVDELTTTSPVETQLLSAPRRRVWLPVLLFVLTCLSTFWVGVNRWNPPSGSLLIALLDGGDTGILLRQRVLVHWQDGLTYMACVLGILIAHEMGHFIATVIYRVPASLPYVIPMPLMPFGTFGAVIGMDGRRADRKQIFDIGLAGPLAGLVVAIPIMIWGVLQLDMKQPALGEIQFYNPLLVQWVMQWLRPDDLKPGAPIALSQLNAYFFAGWVGLLVTGLNMLPAGQLDGGHVIYALFGRYSRYIAWSFMFLAIAFLTYSAFMWQELSWVLMLGLIFLIGVEHPPTRDDSVKLGWFRYLLGLASLSIPFLCFAPRAISMIR